MPSTVDVQQPPCQGRMAPQRERQSLSAGKRVNVLYCTNQLTEELLHRPSQTELLEVQNAY